MKKKIRCSILTTIAVVLAVLLLDAFVPYFMTRHGSRTTEEILQTADNDTPIEDLLTKKYNFKGKRPGYCINVMLLIPALFTRSMADYVSYRESKGTRKWEGNSLEELYRHMPLQCLRKIDNECYYAVYQDRGGTYMFLMLEWVEKTDGSMRMEVVDSWFPNPKLYKSDFEQLEIGKAKLNDVKRIDPYTKQRRYMGAVGMSGSTFHVTFDGYSVLIGYSSDKDKTVTDIAIRPLGEIFVSYWLLPQDRPE